MSSKREIPSIIARPSKLRRTSSFAGMENLDGSSVATRNRETQAIEICSARTKFMGSKEVDATFNPDRHNMDKEKLYTLDNICRKPHEWKGCRVPAVMDLVDALLAEPNNETDDRLEINKERMAEEPQCSPATQRDAISAFIVNIEVRRAYGPLVEFFLKRIMKYPDIWKECRVEQVRDLAHMLIKAEDKKKEKEAEIAAIQYTLELFSQIIPTSRASGFAIYPNLYSQDMRDYTKFQPDARAMQSDPNLYLVLYAKYKDSVPDASGITCCMNGMQLARYGEDQHHGLKISPAEVFSLLQNYKCIGDLD